MGPLAASIINFVLILSTLSVVIAFSNAAGIKISQSNSKSSLGLFLNYPSLGLLILLFFLKNSISAFISMPFLLYK